MKEVHISLIITLGNDAIITFCFECVYSHVETESINYNLQFDKDPLFDLKFTNRIDRKLQKCCTKYMDMNSIKEINPSVYNFSSVLEDVENEVFAGPLPLALSRSAPSNKEHKHKNNKEIEDSRGAQYPDKRIE